MCLYKVFQETPLPDKDEIMVGYKVFREIDGELIPWINFGGSDDVHPGETFLKTECYKTGKWYINQKKITLHDDFGDSYISGYHIFKDRYDAYYLARSTEKVCEVLFREVTTIGSEPSGVCYVAQQIKIVGRA